MGEALDRMHSTRAAVRRLNNVQLAIKLEGEDWKPPGIRAPGISDPTASKAIYRADELTQVMQALKDEERELIEFIGTSLRLIESVRRGLGTSYGDVLEWLYIDCLSWADIWDLYRVPKSTGHERRTIALDWIDSIGLRKVLRGEYDL